MPSTTCPSVFQLLRDNRKQMPNKDIRKQLPVSWNKSKEDRFLLSTSTAPYVLWKLKVRRDLCITVVRPDWIEHVPTVLNSCYCLPSDPGNASSVPLNSFFRERESLLLRFI